MEETRRPSNQRLAFLSPVEKLKELCLEESKNTYGKNIASRKRQKV
jgi:hypothetical protein